MQPRFGFAAQLIDGEGVGFDQCGAHGFRSAGEALDRAVTEQRRQAGVAVAARNAIEGGDDARQTPLGENANRDGAEQEIGRAHV